MIFSHNNGKADAHPFTVGVTGGIFRRLACDERQLSLLVICLMAYSLFRASCFVSYSS